MSGQAESSLQKVSWTMWMLGGTSPVATGDIINLKTDALSGDIVRCIVKRLQLAEFFDPFPHASGDGCTLPNTSRKLQVRLPMQVIPNKHCINEPCVGLCLVQYEVTDKNAGLPFQCPGTHLVFPLNFVQ